MKIDFPTIVEKTEEEIASIITIIKNSPLSDYIKLFIIKCIELAIWLPNFVLNTKISMYRFATMIFGKGYRRKQHKDTPNNKPIDNDNSQSSSSIANLSQHTSSELIPVDNNSIASCNDGFAQLIDNSKKPGHGRMPHTAYTKCIKVELTLELKVGDPCPYSCGGKLRAYDAGHIIRIKGNPIANIYHYMVKKLRCNLCLVIISAPIPEYIGKEKYDAYFKAQLVLLKYYVGVPFYRQENFQRLLHFPLSDATQWKLCEEVAGCVIPVFNVLKKLAGNGEVIHNDDTWLRILSVIKKIKNGTAGKRTGMYTTNILSYYNGHKIALFFNGRNHSGENMADVLNSRAPEATPVIQMCDALSANIPSGIKTILCNCLPHGVRKFKELVDFFPEECVVILKELGKVFDYDLHTKSMSKQTRLEYHQKLSAPIMTQLYKHMSKLLEEKKVEPNSELGKAIGYMLRHWPKLTRFLTVPGAPISNNIVEQALKIAIRNRKAAMFYRTEYSAYIGGVLTSLAYTCHLEKQNAPDYLTALQTYKVNVAANPGLFLPWNYQDTISHLQACANQTESIHQRDGPVAAL